MIYHNHKLFSFQNLTDNSHLVRCKALELIGALGSPDQAKTEPGQRNLQAILGEHAHDIDPRVRSSAFEAMVRTLYRRIAILNDVHLIFHSINSLPFCTPSQDPGCVSYHLNFFFSE